MTPILYASNETNFTSNGIGRLADARRCEVTEERNGQYELVMEYPTNGALLSYIVAGNYIMATHDSSGKPQPFQIYNVSEPLNGFIEVRAWHISYALNAIILKPFTASSCAEAVSLLASKSINTNPFSFWTDKSVSSAFALTVPKSVRAVLGGTEGSLLDIYGKGEYEFDMFTVKLHVNRGVDRGVQIRYGKNLVSLERELDASNIHNAVVPYWTDGETTVSLDHLVVKTGQTAGRAVALDLSDSWDEAPTTSQLETKAQTIIDASESYELKENLKIDFVFLWQTEEYKDIANLERVNLCDTVHIIYTKRGINATAKVIKVVYDALRERYLEMELGEPRTSLYQQIQQDTVQTVAPMIPSRPAIQSAIDKATELISGGFGGYIKYKYLVDGTPSEMLIMDAPSEATATNIIRLNQNGIGFSTDGGATYANAWTINGHLNADFITTGTLIANIIKTGILSDALGDNYWNLDTGEFNTQQGHIGDFVISGGKLSSGDIETVGSTGSQIADDGIIYSDGSNWRSHMIDRYAIERKISGTWTEVVAYALALTMNNEPLARIDVGGSQAASLGAIGNQREIIDGIEYNSLLFGSVEIGNYLYAKHLRLQNALPVGQGGTGQKTISETESTTDASISTSGITIQEQKWIKYGKVVHGMLRISGTIAAGANVAGSIGQYNSNRPYTRATGCGYYGQSAFIMQLQTDGSFTIRNASGTSQSPSSSTPLTIAITYIAADS